MEKKMATKKQDGNKNSLTLQTKSFSHLQTLYATIRKAQLKMNTKIRSLTTSLWTLQTKKKRPLHLEKLQIWCNTGKTSGEVQSVFSEWRRSPFFSEQLFLSSCWLCQNPFCQKCAHNSSQAEILTCQLQHKNTGEGIKITASDSGRRAGSIQWGILDNLTHLSAKIDAESSSVRVR